MNTQQQPLNNLHTAKCEDTAEAEMCVYHILLRSIVLKSRTKKSAKTSKFNDNNTRPETTSKKKKTPAPTKTPTQPASHKHPPQPAPTSTATAGYVNTAMRRAPGKGGTLLTHAFLFVSGLSGVWYLLGSYVRNATIENPRNVLSTPI